MPTFLVTDPADGKKYNVNVPEGKTQADANAFVEAGAHKQDQPLAQQQPLQRGETATGTAPVQMGAGGKFLTGLEDLDVGEKQLAAHAGGRLGLRTPEQVAQADTQVREREQQIQASGGRGVPGAIGQMTAAAPIGMAGAAIGGPLIGGGLVAGMLTGAFTPTVTNKDTSFSQQKTEDVVWGGALGTGAYAGLKFLGAAMGPTLDAARTWMIQHGVQLTPGQVFGAVAREAEEAFKSHPVLRSFISGAEGRGITGFNNAIFNQTMEPLQGIPGVQARVPPTASSQQGFKLTKAAFDSAYDKTLTGMRVTPDYDFGQDISDIRFEAQDRLSPKAFQGFLRDLTDRLTPLFSGRTQVKEGTRALDALAAKYRRIPDKDSQFIADYFADAKASLTRAIARQNPQKAEQLRKVDAGYAMFVRAREAAVRAVRRGGQFSPGDLNAAISSVEKRGGAAGRNRLASGDALLQLYADYGQQVLPPKMPDSGSPVRVFWQVAVRHPIQAAIGLAGAAPYTRAGSAAFDAYLAGTRYTAPTGAAIRGAAPGVAPGIASVVRSREKEEEPEYGGPQQ
jgi:hypothetical protein